MARCHSLQLYAVWYIRYAYKSYCNRKSEANFKNAINKKPVINFKHKCAPASGIHVSVGINQQLKQLWTTCSVK
jgi:hypothetical protein